MQDVDATHAPGLRSWVSSAQDDPDFPIQNLPFGVFSPAAGAPRGGVAIGDEILDLRALSEAGLLQGEAQAACHACSGPTLNPFLALGARPRRALRQAFPRCSRKVPRPDRSCCIGPQTVSCTCRRTSA